MGGIHAWAIEEMLGRSGIVGGVLPGGGMIGDHAYQSPGSGRKIPGTRLKP